MLIGVTDSQNMVWRELKIKQNVSIKEMALFYMHSSYSFNIHVHKYIISRFLSIIQARIYSKIYKDSYFNI